MGNGKMENLEDQQNTLNLTNATYLSGIANVTIRFSIPHSPFSIDLSIFAP